MSVGRHALMFTCISSLSFLFVIRTIHKDYSVGISTPEATFFSQLPSPQTPIPAPMPTPPSSSDAIPSIFKQKRTQLPHHLGLILPFNRPWTGEKKEEIRGVHQDYHKTKREELFCIIIFESGMFGSIRNSIIHVRPGCAASKHFMLGRLGAAKMLETWGWVGNPQNM